jgi:uncharacterized protein YjeT (DUF2065 family)
LKSNLLAALGLMLLLEGLLPLLLPQVWRETFQRMVNMKDGQLRFVGLISIIGGLLILLVAP